MPVDITDEFWNTMLVVARRELYRIHGRGLAAEPEELAGLVAVALLQGSRSRAAVSLRELRRITNCRAVDLTRWASHDKGSWRPRGAHNPPHHVSIDSPEARGGLVAPDDSGRRAAVRAQIDEIVRGVTPLQARVIGAYLKHGSQVKAAKALRISEASVSRALRSVREGKGRGE